MNINDAIIEPTQANIAALIAKIRAAEAEAAEQQAGALTYITALVVKAGGLVEFDADELRAAHEHALERADPESGGLVLRAYRPQAQEPVQAPVQRSIILPDGAVGRVQ